MSPFADVLARGRAAVEPSRKWAQSTPFEAGPRRPAFEEALRNVAAIELACRPRGGIVSADDVVLMLRRGEQGQALSRVARWIVSREVLSFEWQARSLLPLFQFELADMSIHPVVTNVIRELVDIFDDLELVRWFTSPNICLGNLMPIDALRTLPCAVKEAARVDRFVARG